MDLATFRTTGTRFELAAACDRLGIDLDFYKGSKTVAFWIYESDCYLEELADGSLYLLLYRDELTAPQAEKAMLEATLYFDHYVSECTDTADKSLAWLSDLLRDWCKHNGLELRSADEILADLDRLDPACMWLDWYLREWEDAERRAAGREFGNRA